MYFKVEVSSKTGNKIAHLLEREIEVKNAAEKVARKYGFKGVVPDTEKFAAGGIKYFDMPSSKLNFKLVSKMFIPLVDSLHYWTPKKLNVASVVRADIARLPVITFKEWNDTVVEQATEHQPEGKINFTLCGRWYVFFATYTLYEALYLDCKPIDEQEAYDLLQPEK